MFLFTDVVDSTRLWDQHPGDMEAVVERHDQIVRTAISDHGGHVFATAVTGTPRRSRRCRARRPPPSRYSASSVRIGLNTGEAEEGRGEDRVPSGDLVVVFGAPERWRRQGMYQTPSVVDGTWERKRPLRAHQVAGSSGVGVGTVERPTRRGGVGRGPATPA